MGDARYVSLGYPSPGSCVVPDRLKRVHAPYVELLKRFPSSSLCQVFDTVVRPTRVSAWTLPCAHH